MSLDLILGAEQQGEEGREEPPGDQLLRQGVPQKGKQNTFCLKNISTLLLLICFYADFFFVKWKKS